MTLLTDTLQIGYVMYATVRGVVRRRSCLNERSVRWGHANLLGLLFREAMECDLVLMKQWSRVRSWSFWACRRSKFTCVTFAHLLWAERSYRRERTLLDRLQDWEIYRKGVSSLAKITDHTEYAMLYNTTQLQLWERKILSQCGFCAFAMCAERSYCCRDEPSSIAHSIKKKFERGLVLSQKRTEHTEYPTQHNATSALRKKGSLPVCLLRICYVSRKVLP